MAMKGWRPVRKSSGWSPTKVTDKRSECNLGVGMGQMDIKARSERECASRYSLRILNSCFLGAMENWNQKSGSSFSS